MGFITHDDGHSTWTYKLEEGVVFYFQCHHVSWKYIHIYVYICIYINMYIYVCITILYLYVFIPNFFRTSIRVLRTHIDSMFCNSLVVILLN
jgi:hypothetical protein